MVKSRPYSSRMGPGNKPNMLPIYSKSYMEKIKNMKSRIQWNSTDGDRTRLNNGKIRGQSNYEDEWIIAPNGERIRKRGRKRNQKTDDEYDDAQIGPNGKAVRRQGPQSNNFGRGQNKERVVQGYGSDQEWDRDKSGLKMKRKSRKYNQVGDPDYNSDEEWVHDKNGKRIQRKHSLKKGRRPLPGKISTNRMRILQNY